MLKNRIIPCLDVKNGRVVKGINFVDLKDAGDPVEQAKIYSDGGADEICFLDITASNENRDTIYDVVEGTSKKCFVPLTVGGGVRSIEDINKLLNCGADKVSINTAAVENPKVVLDSSKKFGSQCIVVAIDAKKNGDKWEIFTHGGRNNSGLDALEYAKKMEDNGAGELLVTSMDRDGTQIGYDVELMNNISDKLVITIILITILFVFGLIFSVKSPERKVIDSPIMWKDDYSNISIFKSNNINLERLRII